MKSYRYLIIIIVALLVTTTILVFKSNNSVYKNKEKNIAIRNAQDIDKIVIRSDSRSILLQKENGDNWSLNKTFRARREAVKMILSMLERLELRGPVPRKYQSIAAKKLENCGKHIEIYTGTRMISSFFIDYDTTMVHSTIFLSNGIKKPFIVKLKGYSLNDISRLFSPEVKFWRDNTLFSYQTADITAIQLNYPDRESQSFKIEIRPDKLPVLLNPFTGEKIENPDYKSLHNYLYFFSNIKFQRPDSNVISSIKKKMLLATIIIYGNTNDSLQVRFYKKPVNNDFINAGEYDLNWCYGRINSEAEAVLVKYSDIDPLLRELHDFLKK